MKTRILILQKIIPHYRKEFFGKFIDRFPDSKIIYGQQGKNEPLKNCDELDESYFAQRKNFYFDSNGKIFLTGLYKDIFRMKPEIIIAGYSMGNLNVYVLFFLKFFLSYKLILWSFGYDPFSGFDPVKSFKDKARLFFYKRADAVIFYWKEGINMISRYSKNKQHYFIAPNTIDTEKQNELKSKFDNKGKDKIKTELGIKEKFHFIYVGRLLEIKQADLLLKAFKLIENENKNCRLTIIGAGPELDNLQKLADELKLEKVKFTGEIIDAEITGMWIYVSDAFVMPGRLGLSVIHSFSFGIPVISMKKEKHFHSEGIGYIENGVNGFLVSDGSVDELADKMNLIISNPELSSRLKKNALRTAGDDGSIDKMLNGFENAIDYASRKK